jgi:glycerol-3-phosphate dehydrogenase
VLTLAEHAGVEMPIAQQVQDVLEGRRAPLDAVDALMGRRPRPEAD